MAPWRSEYPIIAGTGRVRRLGRRLRVRCGPPRAAAPGRRRRGRSRASCVAATMVRPPETSPRTVRGQLRAPLGIQRRRRLVEQQQRRLHRQRPGNRHALRLAAGQLVRHGSARGAHAELVEQAARRALGLARVRRRERGPAPATRCARRSGARRDCGTGRPCRRARAARAARRRAAAARARAEPRHLDRAGGEALEPGDGAQHRRLPRARRAHQRQQLAGPRRERDAAHHGARRRASRAGRAP